MNMISLIIAFCCFLTSINAVADRGVIPVDDIKYGQHYSDSIYCPKKYWNGERYASGLDDYELIELDDFVALMKEKAIPPYKKNDYFVYEYVQADKLTKMPFDTSASDTMKTLVSNEVPVFVSCKYNSILNLFPESSRNSTMVLGVVDVGMTHVYDLTDRIEVYKGSTIWQWDGKTYRTWWATLTTPVYTVLEDRGNRMFYEDVKYGKQNIAEKQSIEVTPTIAAKTNTVVLSGITSKVSIFGPQYATEGDIITYTLNRQGVDSSALVLHVIVNGYFHTNVSWKANEVGIKPFTVNTSIEEAFNDNRPIEIAIKTLNRSVQ